mmetsp:Transcript_1629/g.5128  ORF Transcript_1629/g.5128 Transcript_1629/m.5128 type:complete len:209 (+) Transcript_1629:573-1199(+)
MPAACMSSTMSSRKIIMCTVSKVADRGLWPCTLMESSLKTLGARMSAVPVWVTTNITNATNPRVVISLKRAFMISAPVSRPERASWSRILCSTFSKMPERMTTTAISPSNILGLVAMSLTRDVKDARRLTGLRRRYIRPRRLLLGWQDPMRRDGSAICWEAAFVLRPQKSVKAARFGCRWDLVTPDAFGGEANALCSQERKPRTRKHK